MIAPTIRILLAEDVAADAELELRELKRAGLRVTPRIVDRPDDFVAALREFTPHVILSDFSMPGFDGMEALALAREISPDTPFVFVSGTIGEEYAIRAIKGGATDYVLKNNLVRLPVAVTRALEEAKERGERRRAQAELDVARDRLREREAGLRRAQVMAKLGHVITGADGAFDRRRTFANAEEHTRVAGNASSGRSRAIAERKRRGGRQGKPRRPRIPAAAARRRVDAHPASHRAAAGDYGRTETLVQHAAGRDRGKGGGNKDHPAEPRPRGAEWNQCRYCENPRPAGAVRRSLPHRDRPWKLPHGLDRARGPRSDAGEACRVAWNRCGVHPLDAVGAGRHRTPRARPGGSGGQGTHGDHRRRHDAGSAHPVEEESSRAWVPFS